MKDEILKLRKEGKSYKEIKKILNCSLSTISYYCGDGQKEKTLNRTRVRKKNILTRKTDGFKYRSEKNIKIDELKTKEERYVRESVRKFQKRDNSVKGTIKKFKKIKIL